MEAGPPATVQPSDNQSPIDILTTTSWETLSQYHPAKSLQNFRPSETMWHNFILFTGGLYQTKNYNDNIHIYPNQNEPTKAVLTG